MDPHIDQRCHGLSVIRGGSGDLGEKLFFGLADTASTVISTGNLIKSIDVSGKLDVVVTASEHVILEVMNRIAEVCVRHGDGIFIEWEADIPTRAPEAHGGRVNRVGRVTAFQLRPFAALAEMHKVFAKQIALDRTDFVALRPI